MKYNIISKVNYSNATIEFFLHFSEYDGFVNFLAKQKGIKEKFNALSVAVSLAKNSIRIIMPIGTTERAFREHAHKVVQGYYNIFSIGAGYSGFDDKFDIFMDILGRGTGGRNNGI